MVAVKAGEVERVIRAIPPDVRLLLFYGPDAGLVSERARAAASAAVDEPGDPFQLVRMDGDAVAEQPGRLVEEATTFSMFGGRRAIWLRPTTRSLAPALQAFLDAPPSGTPVVVEAGDLARTSPVRQLCETSRAALALPCYADERRGLETLVGEVLGADGLRLDRDARLLLLHHLGGDRAASRSELTKLAIYARGAGTVTSADVEAVISDVASPALDRVLDDALTGNEAACGAGAGRLAGLGLSSSTVLALALRHALSLLTAVSAIEEGVAEDAALRSWRGLHFRRADAVKAQLKLWSSNRLVRVVAIIDAAILESRATSSLVEPLASATLLRVAALARSARRGPDAGLGRPPNHAT